MRLKRTYEEFIQIVSSKTLEMFIGENRADYYHLLAIDGPITYECHLYKTDQINIDDFEERILPSLSTKISEKPDWDDFITTFPTTTTELHTYKKMGHVVKTVLVTYQDETRKIILRIQKTRV